MQPSETDASSGAARACQKNLLLRDGAVTGMARHPATESGGTLSSHHGFISALGVAQIASWGSLFYAFPLIAGPMAEELGWSKAEIYLLASLALGTAGLAAYPVGAFIDRGGGRLVMAGGSLLCALLLWGWGQGTAAWQLILIFAGLGIAQALTLYEPAFAVVARRFGARARQGITALTLWGGFAGTVFIPLTQLLIDSFGWRGALEALALINLAICVPLHLWIVRPDRDPAPAEPAEGSGASASDRSILRWAVRQPVFWGLAIAFTIYYATFTGFSVHLYPLLVERGIAARDIVLAMALIGPAQVLGRIGVAVLARYASFRALGIATTLSLPAAVLLLMLSGADVLLLILFSLIYGAANGIMTIIRGAAVPELMTGRAYGAINGVLTVPTALVRAAAPVLAALLWQATGSYGALLLVALLANAGVALSFGYAAWARLSPQPGASVPSDQ